MTISEVELKRMRMVLLAIVTEEMAGIFSAPCSVDTNLFESWARNELVIRLRQDIMGRIADEIGAEYPSDWWQAAKERWFPRWAKKRWPVRKTTIKLTARELYPRVAMPEQEHYISLKKWTGHTMQEEKNEPA